MATKVDVTKHPRGGWRVTIRNQKQASFRFQTADAPSPERAYEWLTRMASVVEATKTYNEWRHYWGGNPPIEWLPATSIHAKVSRVIPDFKRHLTDDVSWANI
jgi:hypothetical protein